MVTKVSLFDQYGENYNEGHTRAVESTGFAPCLGKDAVLLRDNPPRIIVNLELPEDAWRDHEMLFGGGRPMGQREILRVINDLTVHSGHYRPEASVPVPNNCSLKVWEISE